MKWHISIVIAITLVNSDVNSNSNNANSPGFAVYGHRHHVPLHHGPGAPNIEYGRASFIANRTYLAHTQSCAQRYTGWSGANAEDDGCG